MISKSSSSRNITSVLGPWVNIWDPSDLSTSKVKLTKKKTYKLYDCYSLKHQINVNLNYLITQKRGLQSLEYF